jgi:hypothetical protein
MPRRQWLLTCGRLPAMVLIVVGAGCSSSAPVPGSPHASTPSTPVVYTLAESGHPTTCTEIGHGKPVDIDWDPASSSFFVATYNDGTIYRGRLDDPTVPVYIEGTLGQVADGIAVARSLLYIAGGFSGQIRVYDLASKAQVGRFETGSGGRLTDLAVTGTGDVWVTDGVRPVLWHLSPQQIAAGSGTPTALELGPEITFSSDPYNLNGIVAMTDQRLLVVNEGDGSLYRIELDDHALGGRAITKIGGATVRQGEGMLLDGHRLVVADSRGLSIVNLSADAPHAFGVTTMHHPAFHAALSVARAGNRYLVINSATQIAEPYIVLSVPQA